MKQYIICFIVSFFFLTGCTGLTSLTSELWEKPGYNERVEAYYVALDKDILIIDGETFGYTFNISPEFKNILLSNSKDFHFGVVYDGFKADADNNVIGNVKLYLKPNDMLDVDTSKVEKALQLGFTETMRTLAYEAQLSGKQHQFDKRHLVEGKFQSGFLTSPRYFFVEETRGALSTASKVVVTPIVAVVDAVKFGLLFVIIVPVLYLYF